MFVPLLIVTTVLLAAPTLSLGQAAKPDKCDQPMKQSMMQFKFDGNLRRPIATRDGCWMFAAVSGPKSANGVAVLRRDGGTVALFRFVPLQLDRPQPPALTDDENILVVGGFSEVAFLDVGKLTSDKQDPLLGTISDRYTGEARTVVITRDNRHALIKNIATEWISIVDLDKARRGGFNAAAIVGGFPASPTAGMALSADQRYLYVTAGGRNTAPDCTAPTVIQALDLQKLKADSTVSVVSETRAGCNPNWLTVSADGKKMFANVLADNVVVSLEVPPEGASALPVVIGRVPVGPHYGFAMIDGDKKMVVATGRNTAGGATGKPYLTVVDMTKAASGVNAVIGTIPSNDGNRQIFATAGGRILLVSNWDARTLDIIDLDQQALQPSGSVLSLPQQASKQENCNQPMKDPVSFFTMEKPLRPYVSRDGCWIFTNSQNGIAVLHRSGGEIKLHRVLDMPGQVRGLTHDGKILVAANEEAAFIDVGRLISGEKDVVLGRATDGHFSPRHVMGVVTADDKTLFLSHNDTNWVSVIDMDKVRAGAFSDSVGGFAAGWGPHFALSPDERYLYVSSGQGGGGGNVPATPCSRSGDPLKEREGTILVVDVQRARSNPSSAVVAGVRAACGGPMDLSPDGKTLYLADRMGESIQVFDTSLVSTGAAPRPITKAPMKEIKSAVVIDGGRNLLVKGTQNLAVLDAEKIHLGQSVVLGTVPASEGSTPFLWMAVLSADKKTLFVEVESGLAIVDLERLPLEPVKN